MSSMPLGLVAGAVDASPVGAALLGLIQGITEFLPVSSSGHLVLFQQFIAIAGDDVLFDLVLHVATLVPVLVYYRAAIAPMLRDPISGQGPFWARPGVRLLGLIGIATLPTALIGVLFQDVFEQWFARPAVLTLTFAITGTLLYATRYLRPGTIDVGQMTPTMALMLGVAQGLAITPGISRSGTTIAVGLMLGLSKPFAAQFSFLMSVPAILGAVVFKLTDAELSEVDPVQLAVGGSVALVTGYAALVLLVRLVHRGKLSYFSGYCWGAAGVAGLLALRGSP